MFETHQLQISSPRHLLDAAAVKDRPRKSAHVDLADLAEQSMVLQASSDASRLFSFKGSHFV